MKLTVRAYRRWIELKLFALKYIAYGGANANTLPGPVLPPPNESLKAHTGMMWSPTRSYADRKRKGRK